jgi:hypothetical protein
MPIYLFQVAFERDSALPEDRAINTLWAQLDNDADALSWATDIGAALTTAGPGGFVPSNFLSDALSGDFSIRAYDQADAEPRSPVFILEDSFVPSSSQALPSEVAVCLSFRATLVSGTVAARRRGRIFFGPLSVNAIQDVVQEPHVDPDLATALLDFAEAIKDSATALGGAWIVWSRAGAIGYDVTFAWVDDTFDTQRRRGVRALGRTTRSL